MEKLQLPKMLTISNYAKIYELSRTTIYKRIKEKELNTLIIDGITFIVLTTTK